METKPFKVPYPVTEEMIEVFELATKKLIAFYHEQSKWQKALLTRSLCDAVLANMQAQLESQRAAAQGK